MPEVLVPYLGFGVDFLIQGLAVPEKFLESNPPSFLFHS